MRRVDVVLESDRDAVERTAHTTLGALLVESVRLCERVGVDRDRRVHALLIEGDAQEVSLDQCTRGEVPFLHRALHLGDGRLDDVEALPAGVKRRAGREQRSQQSGGEQTAGTILEHGCPSTTHDPNPLGVGPQSLEARVSG